MQSLVGTSERKIATIGAIYYKQLCAPDIKHKQKVCFERKLSGNAFMQWSVKNGESLGDFFAPARPKTANTR